MNILCASDWVIVPVEASPWGMFGLANMFDLSQRSAADHARNFRLRVS